MEKKEVILSPIEVAIDEMTAKVIDIREVVDLVMPDMKKLQLRLQGSVSAQVSCVGGCKECQGHLVGARNVKVIWWGQGMSRSFGGGKEFQGHLVGGKECQGHLVGTRNVKVIWWELGMSRSLTWKPVWVYGRSLT